jgi:2-phospho-L-lactate guanylyltransferase
LTSLAVLVPVKSSRVKSRLAGVLTEAQRREFANLLLSDVLGVLKEAALLGVTHIVSPDGEILGLAERMGARGIPELKDSGVNSAVARGIAAARNPGNVLVVPADLPLLRASEIKQIIALKSAGADVVMTPSFAFDGTNALLFSPRSRFPLSYDDNSFWNHLATSARKGLSTAVCCQRGLMFDVDSPDDFRALARSRSSRPSVSFARRAWD